MTASSSPHPVRSGGGFRARLARRLLGTVGWRVVAAEPMPPCCVIVFYPHTSNWDFLIGLLAEWALELGAGFLAKDTLFRWPLAGLLRRWGGIPVNRRESTGFTARLAAQFRASTRLRLAITPEGTRRRTEAWKSGFYRIARAADVPVVLAFADYARREIGYGPAMRLSGDVRSDMARIADFYSGKVGRHPAAQAPVRLRADVLDDR